MLSDILWIYGPNSAESGDHQLPRFLVAFNKKSSKKYRKIYLYNIAIFLTRKDEASG